MPVLRLLLPLFVGNGNFMDSVWLFTLLLCSELHVACVAACVQYFMSQRLGTTARGGAICNVSSKAQIHVAGCN